MSAAHRAPQEPDEGAQRRSETVDGSPGQLPAIARSRAVPPPLSAKGWQRRTPCRANKSTREGYALSAYACRAIAGSVGGPCPDSVKAMKRSTRLAWSAMSGNGADPSAAFAIAGLSSESVSRPSLISCFCATTTRAAELIADARASSCQAYRSPEAPGSGGRWRNKTSNTITSAPASASLVTSCACTHLGQRDGTVGRLTCVRGTGPTVRSAQRLNLSGSRGREIFDAACWFIRTIAVWSGGLAGPRKLKSHRNPTSCSRSRICGIPIRAVQTAPTAAPDATLVHHCISFRQSLRRSAR